MAGERILVVDDERIILELTSMILKSRGFEVLTANGADQAFECLGREHPDIVLLDYMMPNVDGMSALRRIRHEWPTISVLMFTGKGSEEIAVELMKAGAADYLRKPFSNQELIERIEAVLRLRRVEEHNRELQRERELLVREIDRWNRELEARVEQKSQELEAAHAEIVQSEKLAALGHLSAGLAHEIRNPLNAIGLFTQVLKGSLESDREKCSYLDRIQAEVERIDNLLIQLLSASKRSRAELKPVAVEAALEKTVALFLPQIETQGVTLQREIAAVPPVIADAGELELVFNNLLANALNEMRDGGTLSLKVASRENLLHVVVADTGPGVPREHLSRIFDPFFTTREKGTGFGLSVVLRIVRSCGGRIHVESEPGRGAAFHLEFPLPAV